MSSHLLGVHALVWVGGWSKEECRTAIKNTVEAGYGLIEIPALDPSKIDSKDTAQVLKDHGIKGACSLGLSFDADINNDDSEVVARGEEKLMKALSVVESIGGDYLGGVLFSALGKYPKPASQKSWDNAAQSLRKLAKRAQESGITLGLEPVNRYESNLINTVDHAVQMIKDVGEKNVKVHLDVYHMNIEEDGMEKSVIACGDKLGYVHIGESHRGYLGSGNVDFDTFFSALKKINYSGPIAFESFSSAVVDPALSNTLCVWRNLWSDSDDLASHALQYMKERF